MKCWNWFDPKHQARASGEPSILAAIVDEVRSSYNVDPDRVYVVGVSAGGAMASILGATYPELFAAIAVFAGAEFKAATSVTTGFAADGERRARPRAAGATRVRGDERRPRA